MKRPIHSRWLRRRIVWPLLAPVTLLAWSYAFLNWWGAREKQEAAARLRAMGLFTTASDYIPEPLPSEGNFADIALLAPYKPWLHSEYYAPGMISPWTPQGRRLALYDPVFEKVLFRPDGSAPDFSTMPAESPYGQSAASFLEAYDRLNGETLKEFTEALHLPVTKRALVAYSDSTGNDLAWSLRGTVRGIILRGTAALEVGKSQEAAESIRIALRLSEFAGSSHQCSGQWIEEILRSAPRELLKKGIQKHLFPRGDLLTLQEEIRRIDPRKQAVEVLKLESLRFQQWTAWKDWPDAYGRYSKQNGPGANDLWKWLRESPKLIPSGYFDLNAAHWAEALMELVRTSRQEGPLRQWLHPPALSNEQSPGIGQRISPWLREMGFVKYSLAIGAQTATCQQQDLLACDLELHRLEHGEYPATLEVVHSSAKTDPVTGEAFRYQLKDDGFLLYSVGPDGVDQGGVSEPQARFGAGDWIW